MSCIPWPRTIILRIHKILVHNIAFVILILKVLLFGDTAVSVKIEYFVRIDHSLICFLSASLRIQTQVQTEWLLLLFAGLFEFSELLQLQGQFPAAGTLVGDLDYLVV